MYRIASIAVDQLWQYDGTHYRIGRFLTRRFLPTGLWETEELHTGAVRNYSEKDIYDIATITEVQPGQVWERSAGLFYTMKECKSALNGPYLWKYRTSETPPIDGLLGEDLVLSWCTLLAGVTQPIAKPADKCPLCGREGIVGFNMFKCSASRHVCRNGS